jgi:hypothetical protein
MTVVAYVIMLTILLFLAVKMYRLVVQRKIDMEQVTEYVIKELKMAESAENIR